MLEFVLENCKLASPPSICNKDRFYNEVEKRHDFGELVSRKTLEVDFGSFFLDSKLATTNTTDTASILRRKQYICLQFVESNSHRIIITMKFLTDPILNILDIFMGESAQNPDPRSTCGVFF